MDCGYGTAEENPTDLPKGAIETVAVTIRQRKDGRDFGARDWGTWVGREEGVGSGTRTAEGAI